MGCNNNPTVLQFKSAYQRLLAGAFNKTELGNCLWDDSVHILIQDPSTVRAAEEVQHAFKLKEDQGDKFYMLDNTTFKELRQNILVYISGYIQRRLVYGSDCDPCIQLLHHSNLTSSRFLELTNRGGLIRPNKGIVKVVCAVDKNLSEKMKTCDIFAEQNIFQKLTTQSLSVIREQYPGVLDELDDHAPGGLHRSSHKANIIKQIASMCLSKKIKHLTRLRNDDKNSYSRHLNNKLPIFRNE